MRPIDPALLEDYDHYPRIEAEFQAYLDESLNPRGRELLYEIVGNLGLPQKADVLDLGCGRRPVLHRAGGAVWIRSYGC
jgi:hypothetical protein